ncbi:hypothetical protein BCR44DRAFT_1431988, partial [Catenaria anguillulae PL171]
MTGYCSSPVPTRPIHSNRLLLGQRVRLRHRDNRYLARCGRERRHAWMDDWANRFRRKFHNRLAHSHVFDMFFNPGSVRATAVGRFWGR